MNYSHRPLNRAVKWSELATWFGMWLILVIGHWLGVEANLKKWGQAALRPAIELSGQITYLATRPYIWLKAGYSRGQHLQQLELAYNQALAEISHYQAVEAENQTLRELLEAQDRPVPTVIATPVISYGIPTISVGVEEGIQPGQAVLAAQTLLGVVDIVSAHQSQLKLLHQLRDQSILVKTESGVEGLVRGDGRQVIMTEIPTQAEIVAGEKIVTAGQKNIPPNLFIGTVQESTTEATAPIQTVTVNQRISFYEVPIVEVLP